MRIQYAQCWEDPATLREGLQITADDEIVSIASGGDNTLAMLLDNPKSITAVDYNPAQIYLVELKMRAIENLEYDGFVAFVGARECRDRIGYYTRLRPALSPEARTYWDGQGPALERGLIHTGKFEHYFRLFHSRVLPLIHSHQSIMTLLGAASVSAQRNYYYRVWNNARWRWLFCVFFSRLVLGRLGRRPEFFRHVSDRNIGMTLLQRTRRGLTEIPIQDNYFVEYILTGRYRDLEQAHPYLREPDFNVIKERLDRIRLVCGSLDDVLESLPEGSVSKFNLSDIFEYMGTERVTRTLRRVTAACRRRARLALWTLFVPQPIPDSLSGSISALAEVQNELQKSSRTFFYDQFQLWQVDRGI